MDLSNIPLDLLKAEHVAVDAMQGSFAWIEDDSPVCRNQCGQDDNDICPLDACPIDDVCEGMCSAFDFAERKECYLLAIRAEIERRA